MELILFSIPDWMSQLPLLFVQNTDAWDCKKLYFWSCDVPNCLLHASYNSSMQLRVAPVLVPVR